MKKLYTLALILLLAARGLAQSDQAKQAIDLARKGRTAEAVTAFEKLTVTEPNNADNYDALSQLYLTQGRVQDGYNAAGKGLVISPNNNNLAITKAKAAIFLGKPEEAITLMDAAIARDPKFYLLYTIKGNAYQAMNNVQMAIGQYSRSIQADPEFPYNYLSRARNFMRISRYEQALADLNKFNSMIDGNPEAYNLLGMAHYNLKDKGAAIVDYTKALSTGKGNNNLRQNILTNRGVAYAETGEKGKAQADYAAAIAIDPEHFPDAYYQQAVIDEADKQYATAQQKLEKAISISADQPHYYSLYAKILLAQNKNDAGLAAAEKILALDKNNPDGYLMKASALNNLRKFEEAIVVANAGIQLYPDNYLLYSMRSAIYKLQGKTALAEADNNKAKALAIKQ